MKDKDDPGFAPQLSQTFNKSLTIMSKASSGLKLQYKMSRGQNDIKLFTPIIYDWS